MTVDRTASPEAAEDSPLIGPEVSSSKVYKASPTVIPDIASGTPSTTGEVSPTPDAPTSLDPCATTPHRELPCILLDASTVRRSSGPTKTHGWLNGFIHRASKPPGGSSEANVICRYPTIDYMSYTAISPFYYQSPCNFSYVKETECLFEALQDSKWVDAMDQELKALNDSHTWTLVDLPTDKRAIRCK